MKCKDLAEFAERFSVQLDIFICEEIKLNHEIQLLLENMSQQSYEMANNLKEITKNLGV